MARQKWGQNFLTDGNVARRIVDALGTRPEDAVWEIGPGKGALTGLLAGKVGRLVAVELDRVLAARLQRELGGVPGLEVLNADFLDCPLPEAPPVPFKVLGNLPYSAANPILRRLLDWPAWDRAVVMVQKEVACRIAAAPGSGDYGVLSLAVQAKARPVLLFDVGPRAFTPPPKVVSTVMRLERLAAPRMADEGAFFRVVRAAFGQRRKTLLNSLSHGLELEKGQVESILNECGLDPGARAETISLEQFDRLAQRIGTSTQST